MAHNIYVFDAHTGTHVHTHMHTCTQIHAERVFVFRMRKMYFNITLTWFAAFVFKDFFVIRQNA